MRKISNNCRKNIGKFPSIKNGRSIWYESLLEKAYMYLLEIDPDVKSYQEQPMKIWYENDGVSCPYTPDLLVIRAFNKQIIEVKPEAKTQNSEFIRKTKIVTQIFFQQGYEYVVVTDKTILREPRLSNIKLLYKYAKTYIPVQAQALVIGFLRKNKTATIQELEALLVHGSNSRPVIYSLIFWGMLAVDFDKKLNPSTIVHLSIKTEAKEDIA